MDYFYLLKARIPEEDFVEFAKRMKLQPMSEKKRDGHYQYHWGGHAGCGSWWNPSESMANVYYENHPSPAVVVLAKYENGFLYFKESVGY